MAITIQVHCEVCGKTKDELVPLSVLRKRICYACEENAKKDKRTRALDALKELSLEERVARIEEQLYDDAHKPRYRDPGSILLA